MSVRITQGDALTVLRTLPDESVHCVVTSPPYWGLRDYGVAGQLGLESSPQEYVASMVAVFREVRRVLREDGTCWINLSSSYFGSTMTGGNNGFNASGGPDGFKQKRQFRKPSSDGKNPSRFPYASRVPACGSDGTELPSSMVPDSSCSDLCDGCRAALLMGSASTSRPLASGASQPLPTVHDSGRSDYAEALQAASLPGDQASTTFESSAQPPAECSHCANCGACLAVLRSSTRDARLCARMAAYNDGIEPRVWAGHNPGMGALGTAWVNYNFKPKDMVPIPWMVAMALQADGWYLRQDIIWSKPNPMPESVRDRCTKSHEYIFLLSKSARYYFDAAAIQEPFADERLGNPGKYAAGLKDCVTPMGVHGDGVTGQGWNADGKAIGRNKRSVWTVATAPFSEAHFATFPPALIEPCILAGCPAQCCSECGAPWMRECESSFVPQSDVSEALGVRGHDGQKPMDASNGWQGVPRGTTTRKTLGFAPSCDCNAPAVTGIVLDPFGGAGTTGLVADRLQRDAILIELNPEYVEIARRRVHADAPLFAEVAA